MTPQVIAHQDASIWPQVPKLASIPFSPEAARDADQGQPVMVTGAVLRQVEAYTSLATEVRERAVLDSDV